MSRRLVSRRAEYCPQPTSCLAKKTGRCICQYQPNGKDLHPDEYYSWVNMKTRCFNPKYQDWARYGGRGITVCDRWKNSFEDFFADMGSKPPGTLHLDRIDNDGNYEPSNCRWATRVISARNKCSVEPVTIDGRTMTLPEWESETGKDRKTIWRRLKDGWPPALAVYGDPMPHDLRLKPNCIQLYAERFTVERRALSKGLWQYRMGGE